MMYFEQINQRIRVWQNSKSSELKVSGLDSEQFCFFMNNYKTTESHDSGPFIIISGDQETADELYENFKKLNTKLSVQVFPEENSSPYEGFISSDYVLRKRLSILDAVMQGRTPEVLICTVRSALAKLPPKSFFTESSFTLNTEDIIAPNDLAKALVSLGYNSSITVEEPGTFSKKGEVFDIYPISGRPVRLNYFDELIETIHEIDPASQKTIKNSPLTSVVIGPSTGILLNSKFRACFRSNIPMPGTTFKQKFNHRKKILQSLSDGFLFQNYSVYFPLFFEAEEVTSIFDYIEGEPLPIFYKKQNIEQKELELREELRVDYELSNENLESDSIAPEPSSFYHKDLVSLLPSKSLIIEDVFIEDSSGPSGLLKFNLESSSIYLKRSVRSGPNKKENLKDVFTFLSEEFEHSGTILISTRTKSARKEIDYLLDTFNLKRKLLERIKYIDSQVDNGFFYPAEKLLLLTEGDLFSVKKRKVSTKGTTKPDLFAEQIATLKINDYVIHSDHGVGQYLGLKSMDTGNIVNDFLVIQYINNDKVYVPVYKINLIQKHADAAAGCSLGNLRSAKFSQVKKKAKESAKRLAFDLLKLQAERQTQKAHSFSEPDRYYTEFELAFPFEETPDQRRATDDVLRAMQKSEPMDHLVCGDVGFGKTEIAMRAAFLAALDKKQVAVLVPTTILALQHYNSFIKRFKDFPLKVEFISRFKSPKQIKEIKEGLESGSIDIIIGTHKLLSDSIKYKDLGLVVVDEEQRFGVGHKEKLKVLKATVDFLTLTATPIPRTLQMAFLGLRDLSLIQTPPPKRQSIKTYIIKDDAHIIQTAIKKELSRGGQVFIVHNKVQDIELFTSKIRDLVPDAKIVFAHGQMSEKELESRITSFYEGKYQVLISTTIIESGLDIPNANTMIVDRADKFGLSQLHQLRGRIGRSEKKAYAYFLIPQDRGLTPIAEKRLKAMQTYADIGSGFNIASCDLEIRGAGEVLGANQSGHLDAVGLELYMELLKEAISEIKGEGKIIHSRAEISTPYSSYIPNYYIEDGPTRLKYYKRLSNTESLSGLDDLMLEIEELFGPRPDEVKNLLWLLRSRVSLNDCGVKSLQVSDKNITITFEKSFLDSESDLKNKMIEYFLSRPRTYQFSPEYKVFYQSKELIDLEALFNFSKNIAEQILPC